MSKNCLRCGIEVTPQHHCCVVVEEDTTILSSQSSSKRRNMVALLCEKCGDDFYDWITSRRKTNE